MSAIPIFTPDSRQSSRFSLWHRAWWAFAALLLLLPTAIAILPAESVVGLSRYVVLHTVLELFAVVVAFLVFFTGGQSFVARRTTFNGIALLFLGVALLDVGHTLTYPGLEALGTEQARQRTLMFWLAARLVDSLALLLFALVILDKWRWDLRWSHAFVALVIGVSGWYWFVLSHPNWFPVLYEQGVGLTSVKVYIEYVVVGLHVITAWLIVAGHKRIAVGDRERRLVLAAVALAVSSLCFTRYTQFNDLINVFGHLFKVFGYWQIFQALFVTNFELPYLSLRKSEERLAKLADVLSSGTGKSSFPQLFDTVCRLVEARRGGFLLMTGSEQWIVVASFGYTSREAVRLSFERIKDQAINDGISRFDFHISDEERHFISAGIELPRRYRAVLYFSNRHSFGEYEVTRRLLSIVSSKIAAELERMDMENQIVQTRREQALAMEQTREQERLALARDLHDELGGTLTAIGFDLSLLRKQIPDDVDAKQRIVALRSLTDSATQTVKMIIGDLRPMMLDDFGLAAATESRLRQVAARYGFEATMEHNLDEVLAASLPQELAVPVFRIFTESLNNIAKHAKARHVRVRLHCYSQRLILLVSDEGIGFDSHAPDKKESYGLRGMRERAHLIAGHLRIASTPGRGTVVGLSVRFAEPI